MKTKSVMFAAAAVSAGVAFAEPKGEVVFAAGDYESDFTTGTAGKVENREKGTGKREQVGVVEKAAMQAVVQKILDDAVKCGAQSACQCCVYIDGKLVVDACAGTMATNSAEKIDGSTLFPIFSTEKAQFATAVHIAYNSYPGWYGYPPVDGSHEEMRENIRRCHADVVKRFRDFYKDVFHF